MRIDKFLCDMGQGSRKDVKQLLKEGKVSVNGETVKKADMHINENADKIICAGKEIFYKKYIYLMLNKPEGYISANEDKKYRVVTELVEEKYKMYDVFCVGRLDIDTTGLLILTNDGEFSHHLTSPRHHIPKKYYAKIQGEVNKFDVQKMKEGIEIDDGYKCLPAELEIISVNDGESFIYLTICEGKFHQVKRMFEAVGKKVLTLERISMGNLKLDNSLERGKMRELTQKEVEELMRN